MSKIPIRNHGIMAHLRSRNTDAYSLSVHTTHYTSITVFRGTLTIRALLMGDGVLCYGASEIVCLLLLLLLLQIL